MVATVSIVGPMNEKLRRLQKYPTQRLAERKAKIRARGGRVFDFGTGDPNDPTPEFVRQAMIDAIPPHAGYASVQGGEQLRRVAAEYLKRRFGVDVDPVSEIIATSGSMEAVFHMPMILVSGDSQRNHVIYAQPGYTVFEIAALFAHAEPHAHVLNAGNNYLFSPDDIDPDILSRTGMVFLNYPHNPSGQVLPAELFRKWVDARDKHGFVLVSDEVYCDIYFDEAPHSLLEFGLEGCIAMHSSSKRSGMTGYHSGFLAGDPNLIATLRRYRTSMGLASPVWTQAAAVAAWSECDHVEERRAAFNEKRRILLDMFAKRGVRVFPGAATLFLWVEVPDGDTDVSYADHLLEHGIIVSPGSFYGPGQERFVRVALVPSAEECREAAAIWPDARQRAETPSASETNAAGEAEQSANG